VNSIHAYSTIAESAEQAAQKGLACIAITDHFGPTFLSSNLFQTVVGITNIRTLPKSIHGVRVLAGVEIDILAPEGKLAYEDTYLPFDPQQTAADRVLDACEVVIASYHAFGPPMTPEQNTQMLLQVLRHPKVHILGHCDRVPGGFDMDVVVTAANENGKIIELNCHSVTLRPQLQQTIRALAETCKRHGTTVVISGDAHNAYEVGAFDNMVNMLREIDFPEELILNRSYVAFCEKLRIQV
jgi:putative hydrolase